MGRFKNQCALVTGAAGGIGSAIVAQLRAGGAIVAAADKECAMPDAEFCLPGDLTDKNYCDSLCQQAVDKMGQLDILINNAGVITRGPVTQTNDAELVLGSPSRTGPCGILHDKSSHCFFNTMYGTRPRSSEHTN